MLLDIKKIFGTYDEPVTAALELDLSEEDFPGYTVPGTVEARITATLQGRMLEIALDITADVAFACARCLEERTRRFHVIKTYCVREADLSDPDAELSFTPDGKLDVRELAYTELVLEVPTVLLCSDDCAGLCPVCGNRKPCSCSMKPAAVRWMKGLLYCNNCCLNESRMRRCLQWQYPRERFPRQDAINVAPLCGS